jgi:hypothetical protein
MKLGRMFVFKYFVFICSPSTRGQSSHNERAFQENRGIAHIAVHSSLKESLKNHLE